MCIRDSQDPVRLPEVFVLVKEAAR
jgi:hypothetical protein